MVAGPPNAGKSSLVNLLSAWEAWPSVGGGALSGAGPGPGEQFRCGGGARRMKMQSSPEVEPGGGAPRPPPRPLRDNPPPLTASQAGSLCP